MPVATAKPRPQQKQPRQQPPSVVNKKVEQTKNNGVASGSRRPTMVGGAVASMEDVKMLLKRYGTTPRTEEQFKKLQEAIQYVSQEKTKMDVIKDEWAVKKEKLTKEKTLLRHEVQTLAERHAQKMEDEEKRTFRRCHACDHNRMKLKHDNLSQTSRRSSTMSLLGPNKRSLSLQSNRLNYNDSFVPWMRATPLY